MTALVEKKAETLHISDLKVMRSGAGWYVGRTCCSLQRPFRNLMGGGVIEPYSRRMWPYSRESEYFATEKEAQLELDRYIAIVKIFKKQSNQTDLGNVVYEKILMDFVAYFESQNSRFDSEKFLEAAGFKA